MQDAEQRGTVRRGGSVGLLPLLRQYEASPVLPATYPIRVAIVPADRCYRLGAAGSPPQYSRSSGIDRALSRMARAEAHGFDAQTYSVPYTTAQP